MKFSHLSFAAVAVAAAAAQGAVVSNTPDPFPPNLSFTSGAGCFPFAGFCGVNLRSSNYAYTSPPDFSGGNEIAHLSATFTGTFTDLNFNPLPGGDFAVPGTLEFEVFLRGS